MAPYRGGQTLVPACEPFAALRRNHPEQIADKGVIGDTQAASADFGQRLLDQAAEMAGGVLKQLLERQQSSRR